MDNAQAFRAVGLSALAGGCTAIGGFLAILKRPDPGLLALLLGLAQGVMATLSLGEMILHNAYEHDTLSILGWALAGFAAFRLLSPLLPKGEALPEGADTQAKGEDGKGPGVAHKAHLLRLGILMCITLTLHNAPEGFAVAFASYTPSLGPIMVRGRGEGERK
jgi:zinc transporter, ZIP family